MARTCANWRKLAQHFGASRVAFGARHMAPSLFHLATHAERTLIRHHSEPLRANHIIFGANWHQLAQWTPSNRPSYSRSRDGLAMEILTRDHKNTRFLGHHLRIARKISLARPTINRPLVRDKDDTCFITANTFKLH